MGIMYLYFKLLYLKWFDFMKATVNVTIVIDDANIWFNFSPFF